MGEVTVHGAFEDVLEEWEELADRAGATPFVRPFWFVPFWKAFGTGQLELVAIRRAGRLAALAALRRHGAVLAAPTNYHTPEYGLIAEDGEARRDLVDALFARCRRLDLRHLAAERDDAAAVRGAAARHGWLVFEDVTLRSPYVEAVGSFDDYFATLSRNRRKDLRRHRRHFDGPLTYEVHTNLEGLDGVLADAFRLEGSGWKVDEGTAIVSEEAVRAFYTDFARRAGELGILRIGFLRFEDKRLATDIGFEFEGRHYSLKAGYDPDYRSDGVGQLLQEEVLRYDWAHGLQSYEFLGNDDPHKMAWTSDVRTRVQIRCFSRSPRSFAEYAAWKYGRPLAKRVLDLRRR